MASTTISLKTGQHTLLSHSTSTSRYYYSISISSINTAINNASSLPDNAQITSIEITANLGFESHAWVGTMRANGTMGFGGNGSISNTTTSETRLDSGGTGDKSGNKTLTTGSLAASTYISSAFNPFALTTSKGSYFTVSIQSDNVFSKSLYVNDINIKVTYEIPRYTITVNANDANGGTITGGGTYDRNTQIWLQAIPNNGWKFKYWGDNSSNTDPNRQITVTGNATYTAYFEKEKYTVTITLSPVEGGTATGAGTYTYQDIATLTAKPNPGWNFSYWFIPGPGAKKDNPYSYTVRYEDNNLECIFQRQIYTIDSSVTPEATGWVEFTNLSRENTSFNSVYYGDIIRLEAHPYNELEYEFAYWADDKNNTNQIREFTATKSVSYQAVFKKRLHKITYDKELYENGEKWGIISGPEPGLYEYKTQLNFSIEIINSVDYNYKYEFYGWDFYAGNIINGTTKDTSIIYEVISEDHISAKCNYSINTKYNFSVGVEDEAAGYITGAVSGIYLKGTELTFTAVPKEGYKFIGWKNNSDTNPTQTITLEYNVTYIAIFEKKRAAIDIYANQYGEFFLYNEKGENVSSAGNYYYGEKLTLLFVPKEQYKFLNFVYSSTYEELENPLSIPYGEISQNPLTFSVVGENIAVIRVVCEEKELHFISIKNINIHKKNGEIINQQNSDYFYEDTVLELEPKAPNSLSQFVEWGGDLNGSEIPKIYTVTKDVKIEAIFRQLQIKFKSIKVLHHSTNETASPTNPLIGGEDGDQAIIKVEIALE